MRLNLSQNGINILYQTGIIVSRGELNNLKKKNENKVTLRLRELREERGLSQIKLAIDLDLNQNSISRYETGEREMDYVTLIRIADYFNVSLDYLLGRSDDPNICR